MTTSINKVKQTESYIEYEIWEGHETAGRFILFFPSLFFLISSTLTLLEMLNRGFKSGNIFQEFSIPEDLIIPGIVFFSFLMVIVSTKAYRNPYLIVLDGDAKIVKYRTFFTIRLKKIPLSKLKSFTCSTYERSRNRLSDYQTDKIIGYGHIFFNGGAYINRIRIEDLKDIPLKEWIIFLEGINNFITANFGSEYNFQNQIDTFNSSQGRTRIDVKFKYAKHKEVSQIK